MSNHTPKYVIILAGGKGTRMRSDDLHKVCFPIDGRAAINRALDIYEAAGIQQPIVVLGAMAGQVIETIGSEHEGVIYTFQAEQLGTGHATRVGLKALDSLERDADVLLVAGDRIVEPFVLESLFDLYYSRGADMAFLTAPKGRRSDKGRILTHPDGSVLADIEVRDIWQRETYAKLYDMLASGQRPSRDQALAIIGERFEPRRAAKAFGPLWAAFQDEEREPTREEWERWVTIDKTRFQFVNADGSPVTLTPEEVEQTNLANQSIYLAKASALRYALDNLSTDNAQGEEYLSDMITILAQSRDNGRPRYRIEAFKVDNPNHVMAFNDPAELLEIEAYWQSKKQPSLVKAQLPAHVYRPISAWQSALENLDDSTSEAQRLRAELDQLYGDHGELLEERRSAYLHVLAAAAERLGSDTPVLLVHAPGRLNILGRHVDHQGGDCNLMAINRELVMAVHARDDDQVHLHNVDDRFGSRDFSLNALLQDLPWNDWLSLVNSERAAEMVCEADGDWSQYVAAAVLRLQKKYPTLKLRGMDLVLHGNIPVAAGLSSSSALVVASAEATVAVNQLNIFASQFVDLCGEGEWFVGTRGGAADHAAVKMGQVGKVAKVKFFEFAVDKMVDFPADYRMVICNSQVQAKKTAGAGHRFNQQVTCYHIGRMLIKSLYPQYAPLIHHLRDVNARTLGIPLSWIYRILLRLPEQATRDELQAMLPDENLNVYFHTHDEPADGYQIRDVVCFGLAECERSRQGADLLDAGDVETFGRLMNVSHNGDRVMVHDDQWQATPYPYTVANSCLLDLIEDLESGDPQRVIGAQLAWQPGAYRCSVPEIDLMVDVAQRTPGIMGAQIAGAGLGGCMMVLAHQDSTDPLIERLTDIYYAPHNLKPDISVCIPIAGSGVLFGD